MNGVAIAHRKNDNGTIITVYENGVVTVTTPCGKTIR